MSPPSPSSPPASAKGPLMRVRDMEEYQALYRRSLEDPQGFWAEQAQRLDWFHPPRNVMDVDMSEVDFSWYGGARLNVSYNCVDRHLEKRGDKTAILWVGNEPGQTRHITFRELKHQVARMANVLKAHGVKKGDRVIIYIPMIPEAAYAMLACTRIGAVHSVVFAGFSSESLRDRIRDCGAQVVITSNEAFRGNKAVPVKALVDAAVDGLDQVRTVLVARRTEREVPMRAGRDLWLDDEMARQRSTCPMEWMSAEDPLFILYTSGSTGKPKGVLHTTAGYLVYAAMTHQLVFGLQEDDIFFCTADVGWVTGHSYLVYGPLANGATTVMFEGTPMYPDAGRLWQVVDEVKATILYTAPTALRSLIRAGDEHVKKYSRKSLRVLGSVGEPINPEVWRWYHEVVGEKRCPVVDTWWQTETGGILITPLAGVTPPKPGSATLPFFGVEPLLVDEDGNTLKGNDVSGNLCLNRTWPGQARTIWGDHRRFKETYFTRFPGLYFTGDGCRRDEDGYYWITGRVDDVLNVSGHRLGTAEIESALVSHESVAEAAVVGFPHDIKGTGIYAYVMLKADAAEGNNREQTVGMLKEHVRKVIGPIATPDRIRVVSGLPKTRSGKIMRRILRKVAEGHTEDLGDTSTLADPGVVEELLKADAH
ncbi:acetate--CoA ligase [Aggregicoccus sp. 17bor-14]|uniref:acetate--CoA ligase n=1 Tax=Myxococcaceae TaxID=31 RepID=UPI00129CB353|nr:MULTISPECIES: acetate--CoA ligase [Myxococcaceae]MBF5042439.1 acetate--CoA ligase [Simulacricoccus sp. 17bor-14]MRI88210.1 acetate--CoA ligase [Aggregicoccus sp. 17bor-14]